jgi:hypothetical protein
MSADEIPPLVPPRGEIAPGFWDQYGSWVIVGLVLLLVLASALVWFLTRPKPPPIITPAGFVAQQALEPLREQNENGVVLSSVSRILRHYFSLSFGLPPAERTTTEFCGALASVTQLSPELSATVSDFLRQCDQRKFGPSQPQPPMGAVSIAFKLIQEAERSRTASAQASQGPPGPRSSPP